MHRLLVKCYFAPDSAADPETLAYMVEQEVVTRVSFLAHTLLLHACICCVDTHTNVDVVHGQHYPMWWKKPDSTLSVASNKSAEPCPSLLISACCGAFNHVRYWCLS